MLYSNPDQPADLYKPYRAITPSKRQCPGLRPADLFRIISVLGWHEARKQSGDHQIFKNKYTGLLASIPRRLFFENGYVAAISEEVGTISVDFEEIYDKKVRVYLFLLRSKEVLPENIAKTLDKYIKKFKAEIESTPELLVQYYEAIGQKQIKPKKKEKARKKTKEEKKLEKEMAEDIAASCPLCKGQHKLERCEYLPTALEEIKQEQYNRLPTIHKGIEDKAKKARRLLGMRKLKVGSPVIHPRLGCGLVIYIREGFPKIKVAFGNKEVKLDRSEVKLVF